MTLLSAVESGPVPRLFRVEISDVCVADFKLTAQSV